MAGVAVAYVFSYMLMYVVWEPSVPQWDCGGNSILSYPLGLAIKEHCTLFLILNIVTGP